MDKALQIIGIACFAVLFAEASGIMTDIKKHLGALLYAYWCRETMFIGRLKPLDCPMCLSWWISLIWFGITLHSLTAILYAATCSILSIVISKILYKL